MLDPNNQICGAQLNKSIKQYILFIVQSSPVERVHLIITITMAKVAHNFDYAEKM